MKNLYIYIAMVLLLTGNCIFSQGKDYLSSMEMKSGISLLKAQEINYPGDSTINVSFYKLNIYIDYPKKLISGDVLTRFQVNNAPLNSIFLDLKSNMTVDSVLTGPASLNFTHSSDILQIILDRQYNPGEYGEVKVFYKGSPEQDNFAGFVFEPNPLGSPTVWSLSQPYEARNWWPCKDALDDKADSAEIWITSTPEFVSVSNGKLLGISDNHNGSRTYKWKVHYPIAHYLISVAMGDYVLQTDYFHYSAVDSMPVTHYVWKGFYNNLTKKQLERTIPALHIFSDLFGPYPWFDEKYGHAQCGFGGGMEHQTIASMGNFDEYLIVHELAHQWFGDKITCETWQDIWLNEGFATYSEALYEEKMYGKSFYNKMISDEMVRASRAKGSIYVEDITDYREIFNSFRTYSKGGIVLHMLRGITGDSVFFKILKNYAMSPEFSYSTVTTQDFQKVAESVSGLDLNYFFSEWIFGESYPNYTVYWGYQHLNDSVYTVNISIDQVAKTNPQYFTMPVQVEIRTSRKDTIVTLFNNQKNQNFSFSVNGEPELIEFDPNNLILKTYTILTDSGTENLLHSFRLSQNYPNPFNPSTKIDFRVPGDGDLREFIIVMKVYDILGNELAVLLNKALPPGEHSVEFEPSDYGLASGIYFYNLSVKNAYNILLYSKTGKMVYLR